MNTDHTPRRNIGIFAHVDAGKTTTTERILYYSGVSHRIGEVDRGTAIMDWMEQEQNRGITITSAATTLTWRNCRVNIIDTPGHVDFTAEVERCLRVLDGGIAIFDGVNGVEPQSETVWRQAARYRIPRLIFVNKMDRIGADFAYVCDNIAAELQARLLKLYIPAGAGRDFVGVIDVLAQIMLYWSDEDQGRKVRQQEIPPQWQDNAAAAREELLEQLADVSDDIAEHYLGGTTIDLAVCKQTIRALVQTQQAFPVFCGASLRNAGVQPLMDGVVDYLPAPEELPAIIAHRAQVSSGGGAGQEIQIERTADAPLSALIFKIVSDRESGDLAYVRVYAGTMRAGQKVYNASRTAAERINQLRVMHANTSTQVSKITAGDIGVVIGFKRSYTGDTLTTREHAHMLERMLFPQPVMSSSIEPRSQSDRDDLIRALSTLAKEDPTFQWKDDTDTGELVITGMGELHLNVLTTRIIDDFKVNARVGAPQVTYRESIRRQVSETDAVSVQLAGIEYRMSYVATVRPTTTDTMDNSITVTMPTSGGSVPQQRAAAVQAVESTLASGFLLGYPAIGTEVSLQITDFPADTTPAAVEALVGIVVSRLCQQAEAIQLEPIMAVTVITPKEYVGEVLSGLQQRGGVTHAVQSLTAGERISAEAPLARLFGYATAIRSATKGRSEFTTTFARYAPLERTG